MFFLVYQSLYVYDGISYTIVEITRTRFGRYGKPVLSRQSTVTSNSETSLLLIHSGVDVKKTIYSEYKNERLVTYYVL